MDFGEVSFGVRVYRNAFTRSAKTIHCNSYLQTYMPAQKVLSVSAPSALELTPLSIKSALVL